MSKNRRCDCCSGLIGATIFTNANGGKYCCPACSEMGKPTYEAVRAAGEQEYELSGANVLKYTNPKDGIGVKKWRQYATIPTTAVWGLGVAMLEGALEYGRHNYRAAGVRASVYVDAAKGHIDQFWEGEDIDKDSRLHHLLKAMGSLTVLFDSIVHGNWVDDRPPKMDLDKFRAEMQATVDFLFEKYPDRKPPYTQKGLEQEGGCPDGS